MMNLKLDTQQTLEEGKTKDLGSEFIRIAEKLYRPSFIKDFDPSDNAEGAYGRMFDLISDEGEIQRPQK